MASPCPCTCVSAVLITESKRAAQSLPGLCGMSREEPVPSQVQWPLYHPSPPLGSTGTEGAGPVLGLERRPTSPVLGSGGKGVKPTQQQDAQALALSLGTAPPC